MFRRLAGHLAIVVSYLAISVCFSWPLPLHLSDSFLAPPNSDLGVYVWNLWVFRHEIIVHHAFPFFTLEILSLTPALPLTLQNYTTLSNVLAFPMLPRLGIVATFNILAIANTAVSAYAMFLYARRRTGDSAAAYLGGMLFGFAPFMAARATEHLSLIQAAPIPIFGLLMLRLSREANRRLSALAGLVVAWAFLCDPYYAVYCLFILGFMVAYSFTSVDLRPELARHVWWRTIVDVALLCVLGLIVGILVRGGGRFEVLGLRVSIFRLYTPVLIFTTLLAVRIWLTLAPRVSCSLPALRLTTTLLAPGALVLAVAMTPVLYPLFDSTSSYPGPGAIPWRNSPPGLDVLSYLLPNPMHPWFGGACAAWLAAQPNGFTENVASLSWVAMLVMAAAILIDRRWAPPRWIAFTVIFALLSLGPFLTIAGVNTHVPGPWALVRYVPLVGAARMPTRLAVLVLLGESMLLAMAVQQLRRRVAWPQTATAVLGLLLIAELLPAPRRLYSAAIPSLNRIIAADPRPVRVMNLPLGLRDGLSSTGNQSAEYQYHQTVHEKPILGGYVSRLPRDEVARYRRFPVISALMDLSEGMTVTPEREREVIAIAHERASQLRVGWVVVDGRTASGHLERFAVEAFDLTLVTTEGPWKLYKTSLAVPGSSAAPATSPE